MRSTNRVVAAALTIASMVLISAWILDNRPPAEERSTGDDSRPGEDGAWYDAAKALPLRVTVSHHRLLTQEPAWYNHSLNVSLLEADQGWMARFGDRSDIPFHHRWGMAWGNGLDEHGRALTRMLVATAEDDVSKVVVRQGVLPVPIPAHIVNGSEAALEVEIFGRVFAGDVRLGRSSLEGQEVHHARGVVSSERGESFDVGLTCTIASALPTCARLVLDYGDLGRDMISYEPASPSGSLYGYDAQHNVDVLGAWPMSPTEGPLRIASATPELLAHVLLKPTDNTTASLEVLAGEADSWRTGASDPSTMITSLVMPNPGNVDWSVTVTASRPTVYLVQFFDYQTTTWHEGPLAGSP